MSVIPEKMMRDYKINDREMLEDSTTVQALLVDDLAEFTAFDPTLNNAYITDWLSAVTVAQNFPTDELYRDQMQGKTQDVEMSMGKGRKKYNDVKYFAKKAFPTNLAVQREFGFDDYDNARKSDIKLHEFLLRLHATASKYNSALDAAGFTDVKIAEIGVIATELGAKNIAQEVFIKEQLTTTQERVTNMNAVWVFRTQIAEAAKIIYTDNFAKYQQ